ncbi:GALNT14 isoform 7, partial [Pan troglodytes]
VFGVLWITVLLFFWVTKRKLEVPTGPEVQTPKVWSLFFKVAGMSPWAPQVPVSPTPPYQRGHFPTAFRR